MFVKTFEKKILIRLVRIFFYFFPFAFFLESFFLNFYLSTFIIISIVLLKKIIFDKIDYILLIFFLFFIFSSIVNFKIIGELNLIKSLFLLRFFLLFVIIKNLFKNEVLEINQLSQSFTISIVLIGLDIVIQHLFGKNILGFEPFDGRYNSFFEHEAIAGSYIQKFLPLTLFLFLIKKKKFFFLDYLLSFAGLSIILTLDRTPVVVYFFFLFLLILFINVKFYRTIFIAIMCFVILFTFYKPVQNRYLSTYIGIKNSLQNLLATKYNYNQTNELSSFEVKDNKKIFFEYYFNIFYSAFIIQKNYLIGSGHKSFPVICTDLKNNAISSNTSIYACSTHPHNIFLEIYFSSGVLGLFIFIYFLITLLNNVIKNCKKKKIFKILLIVLIVELIPLRNYGSIFTSVNGLYFWFLLTICNIKYSKFIYSIAKKKN